MIRLEQVKKVVASGSEDLTILHPLDLKVPEGQFLSIVGPSGSGKSTLLGLIAGLDAPTEAAFLSTESISSSWAKTSSRASGASASASCFSSSTCCRR